MEGRHCTVGGILCEWVGVFVPVNADVSRDPGEVELEGVPFCTQLFQVIME